MLSLYRWLLRLYPPAYRTEFGEEMLTVFLEAKSEALQKSLAARMAFCASEFGGVICGALEEHLRAVAGSGFFPLFGSRRFFMRSEFRFPKATAPLMAIILAVIVVAIEKAKAISAVVPHANPPVVPVLSVQFTVVPTLLVALLIGVTAGALAWAVLFALRRSWIQRFSESRVRG